MLLCPSLLCTALHSISPAGDRPISKLQPSQSRHQRSRFRVPHCTIHHHFFGHTGADAGGRGYLKLNDGLKCGQPPFSPIACLQHSVDPFQHRTFPQRTSPPTVPDVGQLGRAVGSGPGPLLTGAAVGAGAGSVSGDRPRCTWAGARGTQDTHTHRERDKNRPTML